MEQKIFLKDFEVVSSGSIIIPYSQYVEFLFDNLLFRIVFKVEEEQGDNIGGRCEWTVKKNEQSEDYLEITMYNQDKACFSSTNSEMFVATISGKKLFFKFCIQSICRHEDNREDKILFYSWLLER